MDTYLTVLRKPPNCAQVTMCATQPCPFKGTHDGAGRAEAPSPTLGVLLFMDTWVASILNLMREVLRPLSFLSIQRPLSRFQLKAQLRQIQL